MLTYQRSRFWSRQSCSQSVDPDEGACAVLSFADHEQLWLTYKALQRAGARRFSFMSHWFYNIISFGGRARPAPVAELGRQMTCRSLFRCFLPHYGSNFAP